MLIDPFVIPASQGDPAFLQCPLQIQSHNQTNADFFRSVSNTFPHKQELCMQGGQSPPVVLAPGSHPLYHPEHHSSIDVSEPASACQGWSYCELSTSGDLLAVPKQLQGAGETWADKIAIKKIFLVLQPHHTHCFLSQAEDWSNFSHVLAVIVVVRFWEFILIWALPWIVLSASENADSLHSGLSSSKYFCSNAYCWKSWIECSIFFAYTYFAPTCM